MWTTWEKDLDFRVHLVARRATVGLTASRQTAGSGAWTTFASQSENQKQILVGHQVLEGWGAGGLVRS